MHLYLKDIPNSKHKDHLAGSEANHNGANIIIVVAWY